MLPVDSMYHILSHEAIEAYRERLTPTILIPMHYRHPDLERTPDKPDDLGGIEGWLEGQPNVRHLDGDALALTDRGLPDRPEIVVFEHSPRVRAP